jgi:selenocysteine lyase/cysteine desulfurase
MSVPAREAIEKCLDIYSQQAEFEIDKYNEQIKRTRCLIARLIGAEPEEITLTHNTSEGIYISLINLPLKEGDKILVMDEVFPAVRYVVNHNVPHLEKEFISFSRKNPIEAVQNNLDKNVRAVVVDLAQYLSGEMIDLSKLGNFLKKNGIYLIVDGIQAIGAIDFNVRKTEVDFLSCGAAKWLFGPSGAGFLFVNKKNFDKLKRFHTGWLGAEWGNFEDCRIQPPLFDDARMFEQGTRNIIGISAFSENIKILLEYGLKNVQENIQLLKAELRRRFEELNYEILTPDNLPQSGIITVRPQEDVKSVHNLLRENNVVVSLRSNYLRVSPHFYNTQEEVSKIFEILKP